MGQMPLGTTGQLADCLVGIYAGIETHFYFNLETSNLVGIEMFSSDETDPCEVRFADFDPVAEQHLPRTWKIRHGDHEFARLRIQQWQYGSEATTGAGH